MTTQPEFTAASVILPADRFRKAGKVACTLRTAPEREAYCGATGYVLQPEFRDRTSPRYVAQYCGECTDQYARENGGSIPLSMGEIGG
ncbi:hypothetical protein ABZ281_02730 [Streptomyces sp. NPDC006265]|uniref:hypothetical protein n=1 Tax=Streptomyces sp. NPDC006265 TaxID=3156740 RepID=UPI0033B30BA1